MFSGDSVYMCERENKMTQNDILNINIAEKSVIFPGSGWYRTLNTFTSSNPT